MPKSIASFATLAFGFFQILTIAERPAHAQQFSAEIVTRNAAGEVVGLPAKLYAANRKVRIETPDLPNHVLIVDAGRPAAYAVAFAQRVYMDVMQSSRLTRLFVPLDPDDPCPQWQAMAELAGIPDTASWRCSVEARDAIDERSAAKFTVMSSRGRNIGWIDTQLRFPVKIETEDGLVLSLRNIQEAPQSADMFEIPATYKKFEPRRLLERIKQSDIWVEPSPSQ